jgi:hypothetical protein
MKRKAKPLPASLPERLIGDYAPGAEPAQRHFCPAIMIAPVRPAALGVTGPAEGGGARRAAWERKARPGRPGRAYPVSLGGIGVTGQ